MLDFFDQIIGYVEIIWEYFLGFIESLLAAIGFLATSGGFTMSLIGLMPAVIGSALVVFVAIAVIKFLIGRQ